MESVYSTLFLDVLKSGKFLLESRMQQTVDGLVDMYIPPGVVRECHVWAYSIFYVRPLQVCSFN